MKVARKLWTWALALVATFALVLVKTKPATSDYDARLKNAPLAYDYIRVNGHVRF